MKRCSGPCVGRVSPEEYADDVRHTRMFLEGKSQEVVQEIVDKMEQAAAQLEFEQAGFYRDQIIALKRVQEQQYVTGEKGNVDVFALSSRPSATCVQVIFVRDGRVLGSKSFFPKVQGETDPAAILEEFIPQFYFASESGRDVPQHIIVPVEFDGEEAIESALSQNAGYEVRFQHNVRTHRAAWLKLAQTNAEQNLVSFLANREHLLKRFEALQETLDLAELPKRIECFDISHTQGEGTVASCVVFDLNGPVKADYRRFNIENIQPGDDYAAMHQALTRRYTRLKNGEGKIPDILLIDGGKGQLAQAEDVLAELGVTDVLLIGVAKGPTRKAGLETLFLSSEREGRDLPSDSGALHLIQQVRDEAHRFAIMGHRNRRAKARKESRLESIPG
ncbi:MAG TPA: excinuclease ABC subunit UvrC, partial [Pseudomonadales bacterium]|nr:excinuclease ABC subunit UvrC [Pseudomonadales bacterium]